MHADGYIYIALISLAVAVAIAWIFMPFAIFGTKPILRELLAELKQNNALLSETKDRLGPPTKPLTTLRD